MRSGCTKSPGLDAALPVTSVKRSSPTAVFPDLSLPQQLDLEEWPSAILQWLRESVDESNSQPATRMLAKGALMGIHYRAAESATAWFVRDLYRRKAATEIKTPATRLSR